jgi:hypothetical protein
MNPGVLLMVSLLSLYVLAMVIFWHGLTAQQTEAAVDTKAGLALKEGQTIVGVEETAQGMDFYIDDAVWDAEYYDL